MSSRPGLLKWAAGLDTTNILIISTASKRSIVSIV
ncbi:Uncharacterised protein [Vibrio cholerae]|nr:Uncharacterised protein [Vibrio cholerae]